MTDTKAIALASTLALGPPRSWVEGCAACVDSRDEQCGKPRAEGYRTESAVIPLERVAETPTTTGDTE